MRERGPASPSQAPADGINFFLTDGSTTLDSPGAFGGSLGYAQKLPNEDPALDFIPGVNGGYLGIGLDALGNYFGDWERRSNGCPASERSPAGGAIRRPEPDKITVRGPGQGIDGYCFLTSTSTNLDSTVGPWNTTLPFSLRSDLTTLPTDAIAAESALHAVRRTVTVSVTPAPDPQVTVEISRGDEASQQVLSFPAPRPVPATYKFGFSASTGLSPMSIWSAMSSSNPSCPRRCSNCRSESSAAARSGSAIWWTTPTPSPTPDSSR